MRNILDKIAKYEKKILDEPEFIEAPNSYIYDMTDIEVNGEFTEYLKAICYRNAEITLQKRTELEALKAHLASLKPITAVDSEELVEEQVQEQVIEQKKDLSSYIATLELSLFDDETKNLLFMITHDDRIRIKLHFLKQVNNLKRKIRTMMMLDPTQDVQKMQDLIVQYELTIDFLNQLQEENEKEQSERSELSKIILVPDLKNKISYILGDILNYLDSRKEVKTVMDKVLDGYFLKTKDTKAIERYKEHKLYEYKSPNGIRVLYIINGGYVFICSLFFKDKQRSIKINNYYEDAINRFLSSFDYIKENINSPDFYIEQDEYVAGVNEVLDMGFSYQKRIGD